MANSLTIALVREATLLNKHYPQGKTTLKTGRLRWIGELQPSEVSRKYFVDIRYQQPQHPSVVVRDPKLTVDADDHLPHIYLDGSLCLYRPGQWSPGDPIAKTILPWTCEWLLHYEFWLATGEWCGSGGNHTGPVDRPPRHPQHGRGHRGRSSTSRRKRDSPADADVNLEV